LSDLIFGNNSNIQDQVNCKAAKQMYIRQRITTSVLTLLPSTNGTVT